MGEFLHDALSKIYHEEARYAIVLLSSEYYNRMYTEVEMRAMLVSLTTTKILPIKMDDADIPIYLKGRAYLDVQSELLRQSSK